MDFSQPNKINSGQQLQQRTFQNFNQQQQQSQHNQNLQSNSFPSFQQQQQQSVPATTSPYNYQYEQQQYSLPNFREADRNQPSYVQQHFSGGDLNNQDPTKNFYQSQLTQSLQQLNLSRQSNEQDMMRQRNFMPRSSFEQSAPSMVENNMKSSYYLSPQQVYCDDDEECDDPNAKVTHFQYPPRASASVRMEKMPNPFTAIIDPLTSFNHSNREVKLKLPKNHQTFMYKHQDDEEENVSQHKMFQSHTKISRIPNGGVRIVTDIFRDDNQNSDAFGSEQSSMGHKNSTHQANNLDDMNEWIGKSIEVTVGADSCEISDNPDDDANDVREDC